MWSALASRPKWKGILTMHWRSPQPTLDKRMPHSLAASHRTSSRRELVATAQHPRRSNKRPTSDRFPAHRAGEGVQWNPRLDSLPVLSQPLKYPVILITHGRQKARGGIGVPLFVPALLTTVVDDCPRS